MKGYIGTYEGVGSIGIYGFEMDVRSGEMSGGELVCEAPDAKFLALEDGVLAAPVKRGGAGGNFAGGCEGKEWKLGRGEGGGFDGEGCFLLCGNGWGAAVFGEFS